MDVRLVVLNRRTRKHEFRLRATETIIGRRPDCDLRIKSSEVSRRHCLLHLEDGYLSVEDLDSVNGTFLNGQRVTAKQKVRPGDQLEVGPVKFRVEYDMPRTAFDWHAPEAEPVDAEPLEAEEASGSGFTLAASDGERDALPVVEMETDQAADQLTKVNPPHARNDDAPIPVMEELEEDAAWHLPKSEELRDLLTQMDDPNAKSKPGKKPNSQ